MKRTFRTFAVLAVLSGAMLAATSGTARAQDAQTCEPGLLTQFNGAHQAEYTALINALVTGTPSAANLITDLSGVHDQTTYATLLTDSNGVAGKLATGRIVVALPDGTVVVDTSKGAANTFANFQAKTINENHNSRVAIYSAQQYPCGVALERKFSSTDGTVETYVAIRAGTHLDSFGTIRISTKQ